MRTPRFFAVGRAVFALALFGMAFAVTEGIGARPACAQAADTLDTNAKVNITVAGEPDITGDYVVDAAGNITMLYVNQIYVKGLTVAQAQTAITKALHKIYRNPQVLVRLISLGGISVTVTGAVATPGDRVMRADARLNDLLQTDAPTPQADLSNVEITHGLPGEVHSKDVINYASYLNNQVTAGNPQLRNGDVVFVRQKDAAPIQVSIRGQVNKPGSITLPTKSTLLDALQAAGGLTVTADPKTVQIQHSAEGPASTFDYDKIQLNPADSLINPVLRDGDSVIVKGGDRPNIFTVTGGVEHPGEYPLTQSQTTLADAIAKAGGASPYAKLDQTSIVRTAPDGTTKVIQINAADLSVQANTIVQVGDNITVTRGNPPAPKLNPLSIISAIGIIYGIFGRRH